MITIVIYICEYYSKGRHLIKACAVQPTYYIKELILTYVCFFSRITITGALPHSGYISNEIVN